MFFRLKTPISFGVSGLIQSLYRHLLNTYCELALHNDQGRSGLSEMAVCEGDGHVGGSDNGDPEAEL